MTMHSRPGSRREAQAAAFAERAAAEETAQLHCMIPEELHYQLRLMAVQERTTMTALVAAAIERFIADRK